MIEISHLVKKYGDHYAVKDLNVRIEEGQIYGFLGPNGAGKSTTMNMITGYLAPTAGTVKVDGFDIVKEPEKAKEHIGYLPEMPPLYFDMTVLEYMNFVADLKKIPKDKKKSMVAEVMEMVKITDQVQKDVAASGITAGVVFVISMHTTTAIMINESLPCVEKDIELTLERLIPTDGQFRFSFSPTANHFWDGGNSSQLAARIFQRIFPAVSYAVMPGCSASSASVSWVIFWHRATS